MMVLHHGWRSSASRRVRLCLEEKSLAYESHVVDMANMEHHSPEYLKINPLGVIPTLIHDGKPLQAFPIRRCGPRRRTSAARCATGSGISTV
jgi:glutathione S-transferase